jgi:carboxyl-terminal processing protease
MEEQREEKRKYFVWLPLTFAMVAIASMLVGVNIGKRISLKPKVIQTAPAAKTTRTSIDEILRYVEEQYVDTMDSDKLRRAVIDELIDNLDPHTYFIDREQLMDIREKMQGELEGIGIEFMVIDDTINVLGLLEGGAAMDVGLKVGDRIIAANDSMLAGKGIGAEGIRDFIKGPVNTEVSLKVDRHGVDSLLKFTVKRRKITVNSVPAAFELKNGGLYLMIQRFTSHTHKDFVEALDKLGSGKESIDLVLDLRHNPGGYLQEAVKILSQLFPERDKLMVYTEGGNTKKKEYKTKGKPTVPINRLVVLVDEGSASASEIIAGAVQDWDRGVIVGRRTYGKGLVQEQFELSDGSALRLTTARYYTPLGRLIQKDYTDTDAYKEEVRRRLESGEMFYPDSMPIIDETPFVTESGKVLYSGNGVMPDVFIPFDSIHLYSCTEELYELYHKYSINYMLDHPVELESTHQLKAYFLNDSNIYEGFKDLILEQDCFGERVVAEREEDFKETLLAFLGNAYLGKSAMHELMYEADPAVEKAAEILESGAESFIADK